MTSHGSRTRGAHRRIRTFTPSVLSGLLCRWARCAKLGLSKKPADGRLPLVCAHMCAHPSHLEGGASSDAAPNCWSLERRKPPRHETRAAFHAENSCKSPRRRPPSEMDSCLAVSRRGGLRRRCTSTFRARKNSATTPLRQSKTPTVSSLAHLEHWRISSIGASRSGAVAHVVPRISLRDASLLALVRNRAIRPS